MSETAELKVGGQTLELNVIEGTEGNMGIDITKLGIDMLWTWRRRRRK